MRKFLIAVLFAALVGMTSSSRAAITGYSNLEVSGFGVYILDGGGYRPLSSTDFTTIQATLFATANANLTGYVGVSTDSSTNPLGPLNAFQAILPPGTPIAEDTFTQQSGGGLEPFSRGDTAGTGAIIADLFGAGTPTFGADVQSVAEVSLSPALAGTGSSTSTVGTQATFNFSTLADMNLSARLSADLLLIAELDVPPGFNSSAGANFEITIVDTVLGTTVLNWAPNGTVGGNAVSGGVVIGTEVDPFSLNQSRTRFQANGTGTTQFSGSGDFLLDFLLPAGDYQLTIRHVSNASAQVVQPIPEPASMLIWGGIASALGLGGLIRRRKK
jgi:hypothetical protein